MQADDMQQHSKEHAWHCSCLSDSFDCDLCKRQFVRIAMIINSLYVASCIVWQVWYYLSSRLQGLVIQQGTLA